MSLTSIIVWGGCRLRGVWGGGGLIFVGVGVVNITHQ